MMSRMTNSIKQKLGRDIAKYIEPMRARLDLIYNTQLAMAENQHNQMVAHNELHERIVNKGVLVLSESELVAKIFSGVKIYLDPRDIAVTPHLALDGIWEADITKAWLSVIERDSVVLDIGANFGYYGLLAAQITDRKNSRIIFFEANTDLIPYINKTLALNWRKEQSLVENLAIADKDGDVTLNVLEGYIGSSSLQSKKELSSYMKDKMDIEVTKQINVKATSVDNYTKKSQLRKVSLIKMDIEGYEEKAYKGMRNTVQNNDDITLFVEFTEGSYIDPKGFYEQMLTDFGHVYLIEGGGRLVRQKKTGYDAVVGKPDDWIMLVFSKRSTLGHKGI